MRSTSWKTKQSYFHIFEASLKLMFISLPLLNESRSPCSTTNILKLYLRRCKSGIKYFRRIGRCFCLFRNGMIIATRLLTPHSSAGLHQPPLPIMLEASCLSTYSILTLFIFVVCLPFSVGLQLSIFGSKHTSFLHNQPFLVKEMLVL